MTGLDTLIKTSYEVNEMTPEEIAEDQGFAVEAVKAKLMQISAQYRKACGQEDEEESKLNFTNDQLERVNEVIYDIALGSEDDNLRLKAACYIRDDKKGRKEIVKAIQQSGTFNLLHVNEMFIRAREGANSVKEKILRNNERLIEA